MQENINIALGIDNNYVEQCSVTILSILKNTKTKKNICFHVLYSDISEKNKKILSQLNKFRPYEINFYKIDENSIKKFPLNRQWISIATFYRLLLPSILPDSINKCIYLDCDILCCGDIQKLWNYDIDEYCAGAIEDEDGQTNYNRLNTAGSKFYFNAGVLLLNLEQIRKFDFFEICMTYYQQNEKKIKLQDQDILNGVLAGKVLRIPLTWNIGTPFYHSITSQYKHLNQSEKKEIFQNPGIIHFTGRNKPWIEWVIHPFKSEYWKYLSYTPFKKSYYTHILNTFISFFYKHETYKRRGINLHKINIFNLPCIQIFKNSKYKNIKFLGIKINFRIKDTKQDFLT